MHWLLLVMVVVLELRGGGRHRREGVGVLLGGGRHVPPGLKVTQAAVWSSWWGVRWSLQLLLLLLGGEASGVEAGLLLGVVVVLMVMVRWHGRLLLHGKGVTRHAVDLLELCVWVGRGVAE